MIENFRVIAIIPARGGSKGIPGKNVIDLCGKPLIAHTIDAALKSRTIDRVVISTDAADIACVAQQWGAEVPFRRPEYLATDTAHTPPVIMHAIEELERAGDSVEYVVTLQPTSPLRRTSDVDAAVELLHRQRLDSVVSVRATEWPPYWTVFVRDGVIRPFVDDGTDYFQLERQQLPATYQFNGAVYVTRRSALFAEGAIITKHCGAVVMDEENSLEIDTRADLDRVIEAMRHRVALPARM